MSSDGASIGINGFGRIGRAVLRASLTNPLVKVTAINDPYINAAYAAYLLTTDTTASTRDLNVEVRGNDAIVVNGCYIEVSQRPDPASIPWKVTYVIDCSGVYTTQERAGQHLASGACRVIVAAPSADLPTFVVGVNADRYQPHMQVISAGSPTGVVLCSALKRLSEAAALEFVSFTAIHAATNQQKVVDGTNVKDWAAARSANNTVPFATGALRTVQKALPQLASTVVGCSYHVPTPSGCVLDLTIKTSAPVTRSDVEHVFGLLEESPSPSGSASVVGQQFVSAPVGLVSSDVSQRIGATPSAIAAVDVKAAQVLGDRVIKLCVWYDNETSYAKALLALVLSTSSMW